MNKVYIVRLTEDERGFLLNMIRVGKAAAYKMLWARILLKVDQGDGGPGLSDDETAQAFEVNRSTVERVRRRLVEEGFEAALSRKKRETPPRPPILDGASEAQLIALACSEPPRGRKRWTLTLLADKMVELEVVESISKDTVLRALKKTNLSLG